MSESSTPPLAPPGAGLPPLELLIARCMVRWQLRIRSREDFTRLFQEERRRVRRWVDGCPAGIRGERVRIRRLPALEDSSRDWSMWMTLDHLRICHGVFGGVIAELVAGRVPAMVASTANVKPSPDVGPEVDEAYEKSCDDFLALVAGLPELVTEARFAHPWFGPLDAAGWHALTAIHLRVHRRQLARIMAGLRS